MAIDKRAYQILIVEDNTGDFALVEDFLFEQIEAPSITNALNYKTAKEILSNQENKFDIILLDLSLPDKTGEQLIHGINELAGNAPVIVLTGYVDFTFGVKSLSLGVSDYLLKDELTSLSLYKSILYSAERKRINMDLAESKKEYSEMFNLSPLPMWVFDLDTLGFLDVNLAAISHYGYSHEEFLDMTIKDIRPAEDIPGMEQAIINSMATHLYQPGIFTHKKKNGELIKVDIQSNSIRYKGKLAKVILATDVTERLNYIKAIEDQNKKLRDISWIQSHVVRAPLARIMGLIPLLNDPNCNNDEKTQMLGYLSLSANELDEIIKEITNKVKENNKLYELGL